MAVTDVFAKEIHLKNALIVPRPPSPGQQESQSGTLTASQFHQLAEVPPALTWFANIDNPQTRRAYQNDLSEFMAFSGRPAGAVPDRHARASASLAPRPGDPGAGRRDDPVQAGGAVQTRDNSANEPLHLGVESYFVSLTV